MDHGPIITERDVSRLFFRNEKTSDKRIDKSYTREYNYQVGLTDRIYK